MLYPSIKLQARDFDLLCGLFECRIMTVSHIADIFFEGRREAAKKRLQKLKASGLIAERARQVFEPAILCLTPKAFSLLRDEGHLGAFPVQSRASFAKRAQVSDLTLRHELEVMDVKAAFHRVIGQTDDFDVTEFGTWPLLHEFSISGAGSNAKEIVTRPDGFIRIHESRSDGGASEHAFFLELDRSTETLDTLVAKAGCYLDFYKSGGFAERNRAPRSAFRHFPFRLLMVLKSAERRNIAVEALARTYPSILSLVWLSTLAEATSNSLGHIWLRPIDYRAVLAGTVFDPQHPASAIHYRRQFERDALVERNVKKVALFLNQS